jgi:hypothetical protein
LFESGERMISVDTIDTKTNIININNKIYVNSEILEILLSPYTFTADRYVEDDGSITLSLDEIDLVESGKDDAEAIINMAKDILVYAEHYLEFYEKWVSASNRKGHIPYVLKALMINDVEKIGELIVCRPGEI